mmetsp:Transcript_66182/g.184291  ORF Transcript_66182/g.184291 Transcript_66182/m.184291 type:complete len:219 (-) Transcript_66182:3-659(-)
MLTDLPLSHESVSMLDWREVVHAASPWHSFVMFAATRAPHCLADCGRERWLLVHPSAKALHKMHDRGQENVLLVHPSAKALLWTTDSGRERLLLVHPSTKALHWLPDCGREHVLLVRPSARALLWTTDCGLERLLLVHPSAKTLHWLPDRWRKQVLLVRPSSQLHPFRIPVGAPAQRTARAAAGIAFIVAMTASNVASHRVSYCVGAARQALFIASLE